MALINDFVPRREAELDEFVHNFDTRIGTLLAAVGVSSTQSTAFHALVLLWDAAYAVTKNKATRCTSACIVKDEKKRFMVDNLRALARVVQAFPGTSNENRSLLGLTVPTQAQSQPAPGFAPKLDVLKVHRNLVSVRLSDSVIPTRLRPPFAKSATVFSFIGEEPPAGTDGWFYQGGTTRNRFEVSFDASLPMGTKVWLCAFWKNERDMGGPACEPVPATLLGSAMLPGAGYQSQGEPLAKKAA